MATYYEWAMRLVRVGGMIVAHNVLLGGRVADNASRSDDEDLRAVRAFNARVAGDHRATSILMPAYDGFIVALVNSR
jgi:predicted O-methyltransferase YrrM